MRTKTDVTVSLDDDLLEKIDGEVLEGKYASRSEAIREKLKLHYKLEGTGKDVTALFLECMELVAAHPEVIGTFKEFWKKP